MPDIQPISPPTDQQLDDIEARSQAATPGPWTAWAESYPHLVLQGPQDVHPSEADGVISTNLAVNEAADAKFIAAMSPEVAKVLVAEVRRLRAQLAAVRGLCDEQDQAARMFEGPTPAWIRAVRAVVHSADADETAAALRREGFGADQIATMLHQEADRG